MVETPAPRKLNVSNTKAQRIYAGLRWDPKDTDKRTIAETLKDVTTGRKPYHDLDLACYLYDADGGFIDAVSGKLGQIVDHTGGIYHSGDDQGGYSSYALGDDEQISVELANISGAIAHIVFKVSIESGHTFGEVDAPNVHLVDAYSSRMFLDDDLDAAEGAGLSAYVLCVLSRDGDDGWRLKPIQRYSKTMKPALWRKELAGLL